MDVWDSNNVKTSNMALPDNGVIYVDNLACSTTQSPLLQNYNEPSGCANVTVSGTYSKNLTIGSRKDIIIGPRLDPTKGNRPSTSNGDLTRSGDVVLGLIADNFVRVQHAVDRSDPNDEGDCTNRLAVSDNKPVFNITIEAAVLSLQHRSSPTTTVAAQSSARSPRRARSRRSSAARSASSARPASSRTTTTTTGCATAARRSSSTPSRQPGASCGRTSRFRRRSRTQPDGQGATRTLSSSSRSSTARSGSAVAVSGKCRRRRPAR